MKDYWGGIVVGALAGSLITALYINNGRAVECKTKQIKARSRKAVNFINNLGEEMENLIKR